MSDKTLSDPEKFIRWFVVPYNTLKIVPNGDAAFVALSIGLFLCERYYKAVKGISDTENHDNWARNEAAKDLDCNKNLFEAFWQVFRNGIMHQASPKTWKDGAITYKWDIDGDYDEAPTYFDKDGYRVICIDPWKFTDFIIKKILDNPKYLSKSTIFELGQIPDVKHGYTPTRVLFLQKYQRRPR